MKRRIIAIGTILSVLLAIFIIMPGGVALAEETNSSEGEPTGITPATSSGGQPPVPPTPPERPEPTAPASPIVLASSIVSNQNPGDNEEVRLDLVLLNTSIETLPNVRIVLTGFRSSEIILSRGSFISDPLTFGPRQSITVSYYVRVSSNLGTPGTTTNHRMLVEIRDIVRVPDGDGNLVDVERIEPVDAIVNIVRPPLPEPPPPEPPPEPEPPPTPIPPGVPRVIISRQQLSVDNVIAGMPFDLTITLLNTSRNRNVRNMEVTITDAEGVFVPVVGVNSFFVERLNSQETTDIVISLMARQDTESGSYPITVTINYEDNLNAPHSTAPTINVPVFLPIRLEVENLSFEDEGQGTAFLSFQVINMSLAPLSNLSVRLEGPFMAEQYQVHFFGTLAPGSFDFYEDTIFPFEFGEVSGEIVLEFEDSSGAPGEMRIPISTWIGEPFFPEFDDGGRWPEDGDFIWDEEGEFAENGTMDWLIWAIIGGGVLLAGIIAIIVVRRVKRKKREAADFDDM